MLITGLTSTPKRGGVTFRTAAQNGSVGLRNRHKITRYLRLSAATLCSSAATLEREVMYALQQRSSVAALKREVMYALQKSHEESQYGLTYFGTYTATIACGSFFRSICGYHVSGIRRKKRREKKARPRSSDDRVSSSHSGGSALATAGTNTAASTGISGPNENFLALLSPCACMTRRANGAAGARGPMDVRGDARNSMRAVQCIGENANDESMINIRTDARRASRMPISFICTKKKNSKKKLIFFPFRPQHTSGGGPTNRKFKKF